MKKIVSLLLVAFLAAAAFWLWYQPHNRRLSRVPERSAQEITLPERTSSLQVKLAIPHAVLERVADREMPSRIRFAGRGDDVCVDLGLTRPCVGTRYDATLERLDGIAVEREGRDLSVVLPVAVGGDGGFRGDGARLLGLDARNFRARARVRVGLSIALAPDWCPQVEARPSSEWIDSPRLEIVDGVWIDIGSQVGGLIDGALAGLAEEIEKAVPCSPVRDAVRELWQVRSIPLDLQGDDGFLNVSPRSLRLTPPTVTDETTELSVDVEATTEISTRPLATTTERPLPPQGASTASQVARFFQRRNAPDVLDLALVIRVDYDTLSRRIATALEEQTFDFDTAGGGVSLDVRRVEVYPAGQGVAIGLAVDAEVPGRFLDVTGTVYVTGVPRPTPDGLGIELADVAIARRLDHEVWQLLSVVFERRLVREIEAHGRIDLAPVWRAAEGRFDESLSRAFGEAGLTVETGTAEARIVEVVPEPEHLGAILEIEKPLSLTLDQSLLR